MRYQKLTARRAAARLPDPIAAADRPDPRSAWAVGREPSQQERWESIRERVEALPEELHALVGLIWYEGPTQARAADALGVSPSTLERQRRNALKLLANALEAGRTG